MAAGGGVAVGRAGDWGVFYEAEEEELVPSVPLASEDSDLGESGDFESFSDGDPVEEEEEEAEGLRTPGQNSEALNIK